MTEPAGMIRASDADRDRAAEALADAVATGRLSLADHNARLDAMFAATTADQVAAVVADLPSRPVRRAALFRALDPHRCLVIGGQAQRAGRFTIGRFCDATAVFGRLDLDLRAARPTQDEITLTVRAVAATVTIIVPPHWRVRDQVLVLGTRHAIERGAERGNGPLLGLRGIVLGGAYQLSET